MILKKKGFSLLELIMVLSIASAISVLKFQDLKRDQENTLANAVGQQIKQVGDAVNGYINIHYDKLSTLTNSKSESTDPGPRTCTTSTNTCTITFRTLVNEGLLPSSFNGINANKSSYSIILKRQGTSPNYIINGLVTTDSAWTEGSSIRYDLLGKAMQAAGIDSGMSKSTSTVSGYSGSWSEQSSNYSNINKMGILGYRVGYDSAMYSVFLRRDGTLPMTGDLNMGGNDINNAKNITASSTITAGHEVIAHNGDGDQIALGGGDGNDYELRLSNGSKNLSIYSPSAAQYTTVLRVDRNTKIDQRLGLMGRDPNDIPSGWGGGLRTLDVYADGTIGAGTNGQVNSYLNSSGDIYASHQINTQYVWATGNVNSNYIHSNGNIDADNQVNAKYVWASGNLNSNYIHSNGNIDANSRVNVGEYVYINGQAGLGNGCSPNGLISRDSSGQLLYCKDGSWKNSPGTARQCNSNGCYMTLPDGTMLQWGRTENNQGGNTPIYFPTSFPNECSNVSITATNHSLSGNAKNVPYVNLNSITKSSVWVSNGQSAASGIMWYAIGY